MNAVRSWINVFQVISNRYLRFMCFLPLIFLLVSISQWSIYAFILSLESHPSPGLNKNIQNISEITQVPNVVCVPIRCMLLYFSAFNISCLPNLQFRITFKFDNSELNVDTSNSRLVTWAVSSIVSLTMRQWFKRSPTTYCYPRPLVVI